MERHSVRLLGLSVSPASYLNPGYEGRMTNQLAIFELTSETEKPYKEQNPKYLESSNVSISKLHLDEEIQGS